MYFQNFRKVCMNAYKLDPLHYYTAPGLSWDALLKLTKINLELLIDIDQASLHRKRNAWRNKYGVKKAG